MRRPLALLCLAGALLLGGGAAAQSLNPVQAYFHALNYHEHVYRQADTYAAVHRYFGPYGPFIEACANGVLDHESGHYPYSINGTHRGAWQEHPGFAATIRMAAAERHEIPDFLNPWQATRAAQVAFDQAGHSFRRNWPGSTPRGCP